MCFISEISREIKLFGSVCACCVEWRIAHVESHVGFLCAFERRMSYKKNNSVESAMLKRVVFRCMCLNLLRS